MMPRIFPTLAASAQYWAERSEYQQAVANRHYNLGLLTCHQTMQRLATTSRWEANRAWHLAGLVGEL
jgi:hypothetical protein